MAKATKKTTTKKAAGSSKSNRKPKRSFKTFISRVNKNSKKGFTLSSKAAKILNSMCYDMFDNLATAAAGAVRAAKKQTMSASTVQTAVRLTLPADLAKHSISEASKAVTAASK